MKVKVDYEGIQTLIRCKLEWTEQIAHDEIAVFDKKLIRGLMKPINKGNRKLEYIVPGGITLQTYLKGGLNKDNFFMVFAQIVEIVKKVKMNGLLLDNLYLDLSCTFINENTNEIYFVYYPVRENKYRLNIKAFLCDMAYSAVFNLDEDVQFINDLVEFLNDMGDFSINKMEGYILREYPDVYEKIKRLDYDEDKEDDENIEEITDLSYNTHETVVDGHKNDSIDPVVEKNDDDILEEETFILDEDEETMMLDEDENDETIILPIIYLIRVKNCDRIEINKPDFKIGKGEQTDYIISDNNTVSRVHAEITIDSGEVYLRDNKSTNGTYVNGKVLPANEPTKLLDGDEITFANEKFEFHIEIE